MQVNIFTKNNGRSFGMKLPCSYPGYEGIFFDAVLHKKLRLWLSVANVHSNYLPIFRTFFLSTNILERLKPNLTSPLSHLSVVLVINAFSFMPWLLEKCS